MKTYKRICVKDWSVTAENGDYFEVKRGKEYLTSSEKYGSVVVFSNTFWVAIPIECFDDEEIFTEI